MNSEKSAKRPNILWITTDQQRYDTINALGNPDIHTPNLDSLVKGGMAFKRAYCQNPICQPSRTSFMTSLYPSTIHVNGNGVDQFPDKVPVISGLINKAGYRCGLIGKLHLNAVGKGAEKRTDDGFSYWEYSHAPHWGGEPDFLIDNGHDYARWVKEKGGDLTALINDPRGFPEKYHHITWHGEKAIEFIDRDRGNPWMACLNIFHPHPPFNPAREYHRHYDPDNLPGPLFRDGDLEHQAKLEKIKFQRDARHPDNLEIGHRNGQPPNYLDGRSDAGALKAKYWALVTQVDAEIGKILKYLDDTGQRENTLILFNSDHGEMMGDHGLIYKGCRFYDSLVNVPMIWNWAGHIPAGKKANGLVELLDIAPTLLDLLDLPIPDHMQGQSLAPVLGGKADPDHIRTTVRCESYDSESKVNDEGKPGYGTMIRDERYKLVVYHLYDLGELYDMDADPGEFNNLWDDPDFREVKLDLMKKSFDATALATDWGGVPVIRRGTRTL